MNPYHNMTDKQLRAQLFDEYSHQQRVYPEGLNVVALKRELYKRGYRRGDIVTIALAALIQRHHK
jgi:hypothetical protein